MPPFHLPNSTGYLVALSGGADSRLLLELTVRAVLARRSTGERVTVEAAHLNHGIRGDEADRDEAFCRAVCDRLGVRLTVGQVDIPTLAAASGQSEETEARAARYAFLTRTMADRSLPVLLTAHNADDGLETLLHHLLRGSGTRGMGGIPPTRSLEDGRVLVRPFLGWTRRDILAACREYGLDFVTDSTNLTDSCTRNRLRHGVTPILESIAGKDVPQRAAARLAAAAREDDEALTALAAERYQAIENPCGGIPCTLLQREPAAIAKRILLLSYADHVAVTPDRTLSAYHLDALLSLGREAREGAVSDQLPTGVATSDIPTTLYAVIRGGRLIWESHSRPAVLDLPTCPLPLGTTLWCSADSASPAVSLHVEIMGAPAAPYQGDGVWASAIFPADRITLPLVLRPRGEGDVLRSHGMTKKLKKMLCDKNIPNDLRNRLPLICLSDGTPLWFPGVAFRDGYPPPADGQALRITVYLTPTAT